MAMPAPVAAHANSRRAVQITRLSLAASWFRYSDRSSVEPRGTALRMLVAVHAMSSSPTAMALPR